MPYVPQVEVDKYEEQLQAKVSKVKALFADFDKLPEVEVFRSPPEHYRCRCEFAVWHEGDETYYIMYDAVPGEKKPQRRRIEQYPVAAHCINEMMPLLLCELRAHELLRRKLFQVNFHATVAGDAMVTLIYHKKLVADEVEWRRLAQGLRAKLQEGSSATAVHVIGRSKGAKLLVERDFVVESMEVEGRRYLQKQVEGAFSQPNGHMCAQMVAWAVRATRNSPGDLLELYCGNGNFTVPVAQNFRRVVATELSKASVAAARDNIADNGVANIFMVRMSSEEFVEAWRTRVPKRRLEGLDWDALDLRTLLVDPPRAGLDADTEKLMAGFERVVYVSCNPETLHANLQCVKATHEIRAFAVFDQFPFTHHVECGAFLVRRDT